MGFNEPGSLINARTRLIALDHSTRAAAAMEFGGLSQVPRKAITMGIAPIMSAKRIVLPVSYTHLDVYKRQIPM